MTKKIKSFSLLVYLKKKPGKYLEENKILIPKNLEREVLSVIKHYEYDFFTEINKLLSKEVKMQLGNLLKEKTRDNKSLISYLRSDKGGVSLETVLENIEKLKKINYHEERSFLFVFTKGLSKSF